MSRFRYLLENQAFGVCSSLGEKMGIAAGSIRLYFIYLSCLTMGSPVVIYLIMAFWMNINKHLRRFKNPVLDEW